MSPLSHRLRPGELAAGLYYAQPEEVDALLETGEHLDFTDFKHACVDIAVHERNASPAFRKTALYLGRRLDVMPRRELEDALEWYSYNPNLGIRNQILIDTQALADIVQQHEDDTFDVSDSRFTQKNWRVMRAVIRAETELQFIPQWL